MALLLDYTSSYDDVFPWPFPLRLALKRGLKFAPSSHEHTCRHWAGVRALGVRRRTLPTQLKLFRYFWRWIELP